MSQPTIAVLSIADDPAHASRVPSPRRPEPEDAGPPRPVKVWRLVDRAQHGDASAFAEIYDLYVAVIHRYVRLHAQDLNAAENVTADTFLHALRHIGSFTWTDDLCVWLIDIARTMIDRDRRESGPYPNRPSAAPGRQDHHPRLVAAIGRLPWMQRECVMLRFVVGFSIRQTALSLRVSAPAVWMLQLRSVQSLRSDLRRRSGPVAAWR